MRPSSLECKVMSGWSTPVCVLYYCSTSSSRWPQALTESGDVYGSKRQPAAWSLFQLNEEWPCSAQRQLLYYDPSPSDDSSSVIQVWTVCVPCVPTYGFGTSVLLCGYLDRQICTLPYQMCSKAGALLHGSPSPPLLLVACTAGRLTLRLWVWRQTNSRK